MVDSQAYRQFAGTQGFGKRYPVLKPWGAGEDPLYRHICPRIAADPTRRRRGLRAVPHTLPAFDAPAQGHQHQEG